MLRGIAAIGGTFRFLLSGLPLSLALLGGCASERLLPPETRPPERIAHLQDPAGNVVFIRASRAQLNAIDAGIDTTSDISKTIRAVTQRSGAANGFLSTQDAAAEDSAAGDAAVTSDGVVIYDLTTNISISSGHFYAAYDAYTTVVSGYARRVFLQVMGTYDATGNPTKRFSDVCGDAWYEIYKQACRLRNTFDDMNCFNRISGQPSTRTIFAQGQHSAQFRTGPFSAPPSSSSSTCAIPIPNQIVVDGGGTVQVGRTLALTATPIVEGGPMPEACSSFSWSSSNPAVANVDAAGLVSGVTSGSSSISAACSGVTVFRSSNAFPNAARNALHRLPIGFL